MPNDIRGSETALSRLTSVFASRSSNRRRGLAPMRAVIVPQSERLSSVAEARKRLAPMSGGCSCGARATSIG
jgi:hypothetical protein